jgi:hypothetical protein
MRPTIGLEALHKILLPLLRFEPQFSGRPACNPVLTLATLFQQQ